MIKYCFFGHPVGYGHAAVAYIRGLLDQGIEVWPSPMFWYQGDLLSYEEHPQAEAYFDSFLSNIFGNGPEIETFRSRLYQSQNYDIVFMHVLPGFWHTLREHGKKCAGYTVWETTKLPRIWVQSINHSDQVLVPPKFNKPVFEESGVIPPVSVVPHILRVPGQAPGETLESLRDYLEIPPNHTVFYTINEWTPRKAMDTLVKLYLRAFTGQDNVLLLIKTTASGPPNSGSTDCLDTNILLSDIVDEFPDPAKIRMINGDVSQASIDALHSIGDCYLCFSHAEGWGLGLFEAAGIGNPVLTTNWGGAQDYLGELPASLVDCRIVPAVDALAFGDSDEEQFWGEIDHDDAIHKMREFHSNPAAMREGAEKYKYVLRQKYSTARVSGILKNAIFD